jgi:hypothetical protein
MLTFDSIRQIDLDPLKELVKVPDLPEQIEVGESSDYWIYINRRTRKIALVSKQTGEIIARCDLDDAEAYGLSKHQIGAAKDALKL